MNGVNKTMYIPLYGKAYVSRKGIILNDKKAEEIWNAEQFDLKGKAKSKWLAYYMGMRSAVFDNWAREQTSAMQDAVVLHVGCGLDSRVLRVGAKNKWYDVDFSEVIEERKKYYTPNENYKMLSGDIRDSGWLAGIPKGKRAVVVMEGVSMYVTCEELQEFTKNLRTRFEQVSLLLDCYTLLGAKMSKYKNPVKGVGVAQVYGLEKPELLNDGDFAFVKEYTMTPKNCIDQLKGVEKFVFKKLYAGSLSKKLYKIYEYNNLSTL